MEVRTTRMRIRDRVSTPSSERGPELRLPPSIYFEDNFLVNSRCVTCDRLFKPLSYRIPQKMEEVKRTRPALWVFSINYRLAARLMPKRPLF